MRIHLQDEVHATRKVGNIFLTNIHRVYTGKDVIASFEDEDTTAYFLGEKPVVKTGDSKVDL